jgi:type I restriction enzyme S subunit
LSLVEALDKFTPLDGTLPKNAAGTSSTMPKINQSIVSNTLIPLPPVNEQKRIVEKIDKLMDYCNSLEQSIEESKQESEKLMKAVLQKFIF